MPSLSPWSSSRIAVCSGELAMKMLVVVMALGSFRQSACSFVAASVKAFARTKLSGEFRAAATSLPVMPVKGQPGAGMRA
jgi:hypothetical protein